MRINATDEAGQTGNALLTVDVNRNLYPPVLTPPLYRRITIDDNQSPDRTLTTVIATGMYMENYQMIS